MAREARLRQHSPMDDPQTTPQPEPPPEPEPQPAIPDTIIDEALLEFAREGAATPAPQDTPSWMSVVGRARVGLWRSGVLLGRAEATDPDLPTAVRRAAGAAVAAVDGGVPADDEFNATLIDVEIVTRAEPIRPVGLTGLLHATPRRHRRAGAAGRGSHGRGLAGRRAERRARQRPLGEGAAARRAAAGHAAAAVGGGGAVPHARGGGDALAAQRPPGGADGDAGGDAARLAAVGGGGRIWFGRRGVRACGWSGTSARTASSATCTSTNRGVGRRTTRWCGRRAAPGRWRG